MAVGKITGRAKRLFSIAVARTCRRKCLLSKMPGVENDQDDPSMATATVHNGVT
jgi:hypothetical protein